MAELSRIEYLYHAAKENSNLGDSWLRLECATDPELYQQVKALLQVSCDTDDGVLNQKVSLDPSIKRELWNSSAMTIPKPGDVISSYQICKHLGAGGMGTVFLAKELTPIQRNVAIKLSHSAGNVAETQRRFAVERQVLASLSHSGIPEIYNAGTDSLGREFLVLEYVDGAPIAEYCRSETTGIELQLQLFMDLCKIVSHAHRHNIVHRDIKSTNVLVATTDGTPTASLIDFGIAYVSGDSPDTICGNTQTGQVLGTPGCMSPEQFLPRSGDIDGRSDIYSLGLLLHKILTNVSPFETDSQDPAAKLERLHQPSKISSNCLLPCPQHQKDLLDIIGDRCLRVSPADRYQNADELLEDVSAAANKRKVLASTWLSSADAKRNAWQLKNPVLLAMLCLLALLLPGGTSQQPLDDSLIASVPATPPEATQLIEVDGPTFQQIQSILSEQGLQNALGQNSIIVRSSANPLSAPGPVVSLANRPVAKMDSQLVDSSELAAHVRSGGHSG